MSENNDDVSKITIISLVVLTLAVSLVGSWVVLYEVSQMSEQEYYMGSNTGEAKLKIQYPKEPVSNTGTASLEIIRPPEVTNNG